jgi:hypothetical protein
MHFAEIVVHVVQRDGVTMIVNLVRAVAPADDERGVR